MICQNEGCPNTTSAKNGVCTDCWHARKLIKKYLHTKEGIEKVAEILLTNFRMRIVSLTQEELMKIDEPSSMLTSLEFMEDLNQ